MSQNKAIKLLENEEIIYTFHKGGSAIALPFLLGIVFLIGIIKSLWMIINGNNEFFQLITWIIFFTISVYIIFLMGKYIGYITNIRIIGRDGFDNIQSINITTIESVSSSGFTGKIQIIGKSGSHIIFSGIDDGEKIEQIIREQQAKKL